MNFLSNLISGIGGSFLPSKADIQQAEDQITFAVSVAIGLEVFIVLELFLLVILFSRKGKL